MLAQSSRSTAFTLVELLMVIAIIGLLAALIFPVFAKAQGKARQTTCASNLRQLGQAFVLYAQDYDQRLPQQSAGAGDDGSATTIHIALDTYLRPYSKTGKSTDALLILSRFPCAYQTQT